MGRGGGGYTASQFGPSERPLHLPTNWTRSSISKQTFIMQLFSKWYISDFCSSEFRHSVTHLSKAHLVTYLPRYLLGTRAVRFWAWSAALCVSVTHTQTRTRCTRLIISRRFGGSAAARGTFDPRHSFAELHISNTRFELRRFHPRNAIPQKASQRFVVVNKSAHINHIFHTQIPRIGDSSTKGIWRWDNFTAEWFSIESPSPALCSAVIVDPQINCVQLCLGPIPIH